MYWLVRNIQPRTVVEIGTCIGASTIWIAAALKASGIADAILHTFDDFAVPTDKRLSVSPLFHNRRVSVEARIFQAGLGELVRYHVGDSKVMIPMSYNELSKPGVEVAFIDGDHSLTGVAGDLAAIEPVLRVGGYVILHDVFPEVCSHQGPRKLLDELPSFVNGRYQVCEFYTAPINYGLAILRRIA